MTDARDALHQWCGSPNSTRKRHLPQNGEGHQLFTMHALGHFRLEEAQGSRFAALGKQVSAQSTLHLDVRTPRSPSQDHQATASSSGVCRWQKGEAAPTSFAEGRGINVNSHFDSGNIEVLRQSPICYGQQHHSMVVSIYLLSYNLTPVMGPIPGVCRWYRSQMH